MSIWNKVLVGLSLVVALAYFSFAALALKARSYWGESIKKHEEGLANVAKEKQLLLDGNAAEGKPGVRRLAGEVHQLVIGRGRVWRGSMPRLVKAETGEATVVTQLPAPHRDALKAQMFVFEEPSAQSKGAFLGEFLVAAVADRQWQLQPVRPMTDAERERLKLSRGPWSLYEVMPGEPMEVASEDAAAPKADQAAGPEAAKKEESQPPKAGSPEWQEKLIDYHVLFSEFYRQRALLNDLIAATTADTQAVENAAASARQGVDLLQKEIAATKEERKAVQAELDLAAKHRAELEARLAQLKDAVEKTEQANRAAASELARLQLEAIRRIDERTSKIARAAAAK
jgi:FtsZ-binding cell division protein ZapB